MNLEMLRWLNNDIGGCVENHKAAILIINVSQMQLSIFKYNIKRQEALETTEQFPAFVYTISKSKEMQKWDPPALYCQGGWSSKSSAFVIMINGS